MKKVPMAMCFDFYEKIRRIVQLVATGPKKLQFVDGA